MNHINIKRCLLNFPLTPNDTCMVYLSTTHIQEKIEKLPSILFFKIYIFIYIHIHKVKKVLQNTELPNKTICCICTKCLKEKHLASLRGCRC